MIDSMMLFQTEGETPYWSDSIYHFYPTVNRDLLTSLGLDAKRQYLFDALDGTYQELVPLLGQKVDAYS